MIHFRISADVVYENIKIVSITTEVAQWLKNTYGAEVRVVNIRSDLGWWAWLTDDQVTFMSLKFS